MQLVISDVLDNTVVNGNKDGIGPVSSGVAELEIGEGSKRKRSKFHKPD